ncbi:MAG: hypothetical protein AAF745_06940 [Planctomycetota bacterium]
MAKYYVHCGMRNLVVDAADAKAAAMHLIDNAMQPHLWIYDDSGLSGDDRRDHVMLEALLHLAPEIRVSQQGHGRDDAEVIGTPETVGQWHRTMTVLAGVMRAAGLCPRPFQQLAASSSRDAVSNEHGFPVDGLPLRPIRKPH